MTTEPKNRFELQAMTIDELVSLAKVKLSRKLPFKENLVNYLVEVLGVSEEKALFEALCGDYGLKPTDWNRPFVQGRTTLRITGFNPGKPKNKFNLTSDAGKKSFEAKWLRVFTKDGDLTNPIPWGKPEVQESDPEPENNREPGDDSESENNQGTPDPVEEN